MLHATSEPSGNVFWDMSNPTLCAVVPFKRWLALRNSKCNGLVTSFNALGFATARTEISVGVAASRVVLSSAAVAVVVPLVMIHNSLVLSHILHFLIHFVRCSVFRLVWFVRLLHLIGAMITLYCVYFDRNPPSTQRLDFWGAQNYEKKPKNQRRTLFAYTIIE